MFVNLNERSGGNIMFNQKIKLFHVIIILFIILVFIFGLIYNVFMKKDESKNEYELEDVLVEETEEIDPPMVIEDKSIYIDVKGEVEKNGVYEMKSGNRVKDVIELAGGFTNEADTKQVNLAKLLEDEMVIYIPKIGEIPPLEPASSEEGKISLNKATIEELQTLTGIGPAKAAAILSYREENGPFKQIEDLMLITGIGEKSFEKIKDELILN